MMLRPCSQTLSSDTIVPVAEYGRQTEEIKEELLRSIVLVFLLISVVSAGGLCANSA